MQLDKLAVSAVQMFRGANQFEFAARMAEQNKRTPHLLYQAIGEELHNVSARISRYTDDEIHRHFVDDKFSSLARLVSSRVTCAFKKKQKVKTEE